MNNKTIKALNVDEFKVLKQIIIIDDKKFGETTIGNILYNRDFSNNYKFKKDLENNEESDILRLLKEYPKQENYPNDRIDDIIFKSVKDEYPKSILHNHLIIFNTDIEKLERLKNKNKLCGIMFFEPIFEDYSDLSKFAGKIFKSPIINFDIYSDYKEEIRENQSFSAKYFLDEVSLLDEIKKISFQ